MIKYDPDLPDCVIFDIDGTLAEKGNRNAFDFSKVSEDKVIKPVKDFINGLTEVKKFVFSGRDDSCYDDTKKWLVVNGITCHELVMRETKDNRKDSIVKKEMYEKYIKGKYNLLFVCDDRKSVIREWQHMNIFTFDVSQDVDNVDEF